jgi:hypothetical protein
MRGVKTRRIRLWVKRRLLSRFLRLGSCGTAFANCTGTVLYSSEDAVKFVGRILHGGTTYVCGERDDITANLCREAIKEAFGRRDDQRTVASRFAHRAGSPMLAAVRHEIETKRFHGLVDRDTGFQLREIHEGHCERP